MSVAKRLIDILLSLIGLIILLPFLPIIGLLIKLDSKGPVFYLADRVGKDMKNFKMYKFRTMLDTPLKVGDSVSPQYDPRVTTFGRFLRRTKINELPQFINILKGEMTFVGPRPEAPDLAELYPEDAKRIFSVKPGLVGANTMFGRNEEEFYPPGVDVKKYYIDIILPKKVELDLEYIENPTLFKDLRYILIGVKETLVGALSKRHIQDNRSQIYLLIADLFLIVCSYIFACIVFFGTIPGKADLIRVSMNLPIVILIRLFCNVYFGMYNTVIRYISYYEILGVFKGITCGSLLLVLPAFLFGFNYYSNLVAVIDWACLVVLLSGLRFGLRFYWEKRHQKTEVNEKHRILIYGAGDVGNSARRALNFEKNSPFEVVGFIDDSPDKYGKTLNGLKVLGNRHHIKALSGLYRVEEIVLADPEANPDMLTEIVEICQEADLKYRIFSSVKDLDSMSRYTFPIRNLEFSDILPLQRIHADHAAVKEILANKTALVNASGGALGLELCRQILQMGCRKLIIVDRYESYLNEMVAALCNTFSRELIVPVLTDIDRIDTIEEVFDRYRPNFVFHAGMRKYVPLIQVGLADIGRNNYLRTFNLAKVASKFECELFVMISSLLAAKGGNLITDSLRIAEVALDYFLSDTNTRLIIARICDIAENRGGIVSIIEDQIRNQETVILPSADAQTWLISKYSAAEFILQSLVEGSDTTLGRNVFVCEPRPPVRFVEVARKLANLYGLRLGADLPIRYIDQSEQEAALQPENISSSTHQRPMDVKNGTQDRRRDDDTLKAVFRDFVLSDTSNLSSEDWERQTRELINFCGLDIFLRES